MTASVHDDAARSFAIGFYGGLGERASLADACEQGRAAMSLTGWRGSGLPNLRARKGLDANQLILAADPSSLPLTLDCLSGIESRRRRRSRPAACGAPYSGLLFSLP